MSASTLKTARDELRREVAVLLGYGRTAANWSEAQVLDIDQAVLEGLRRFYMDYPWTFLRPVVTFDTAANQTDYNLPGMFAYIVGPLIVTGQGAPYEVQQISETEYARLKESGTSAGIPKYFVIGSTQAAQTVFRPEVIRVWPTPDAAYGLRAVMQLTPNNLTAEITDPPGCVNHAQTILAACRAQAKLMRDGEAGVYMQEYQDRLEASKLLDDRKRPEYLGTMRSLGGGVADNAVLPRLYPNVVVNGVST
jgi:hypothetical protein